MRPLKSFEDACERIAELMLPWKFDGQGRIRLDEDSPFEDYPYAYCCPLEGLAEGEGFGASRWSDIPYEYAGVVHGKSPCDLVWELADNKAYFIRQQYSTEFALLCAACGLDPKKVRL
jgi:hypothetical protein